LKLAIVTSRLSGLPSLSLPEPVLHESSHNLKKNVFVRDDVNENVSTRSDVSLMLPSTIIPTRSSGAAGVGKLAGLAVDISSFGSTSFTNGKVILKAPEVGTVAPQAGVPTGGVIMPSPLLPPPLLPLPPQDTKAKNTIQIEWRIFRAPRKFVSGGFGSLAAPQDSTSSMAAFGGKADITLSPFTDDLQPQ